MKWNQHRQTQRKRHKEGIREKDGEGVDTEMPKENCQSSRHAEFLYFIAYFPLTLLLLFFLALALLLLIFLVYCKQNKTQSKHTFSTQRERGRQGGREAEPTHLYVNMKSSKHTHLACSNTHSYKHTHTRPHSHTHMWTFTHSHTHISRRTHVGYLMLFSIQATLFAAAFAAPSRVFIFSHPLKQPLQSPCI